MYVPVYGHVSNHIGKCWFWCFPCIWQWGCLSAKLASFSIYGKFGSWNKEWDGILPFRLGKKSVGTFFARSVYSFQPFSLQGRRCFFYIYSISHCSGYFIDVISIKTKTHAVLPSALTCNTVTTRPRLSFSSCLYMLFLGIFWYGLLYNTSHESW